MKNIMIVILVLLMGMQMTCVYAGQVSSNGLTAEQVAMLEASIATQKAENIRNEATTGVMSGIATVSGPDELNRYAEMSKAIAMGLAAAAKELGMAANEFMVTPAGKLVTILVVYKYIGAELIGFLMSYLVILPLLFIALRTVLYWMRLKEYKYDEKGKKQYVANNLNSDDRDGQIKVATVFIYLIWVIATLITAVVSLPV